VLCFRHNARHVTLPVGAVCTHRILSCVYKSDSFVCVHIGFFCVRTHWILLCVYTSDSFVRVQSSFESSFKFVSTDLLSIHRALLSNYRALLSIFGARLRALLNMCLGLF